MEFVWGYSCIVALLLLLAVVLVWRVVSKGGRSQKPMHVQKEQSVESDVMDAPSCPKNILSNRSPKPEAQQRAKITVRERRLLRARRRRLRALRRLRRFQAPISSPTSDSDTEDVAAASISPRSRKRRRVAVQDDAYKDGTSGAALRGEGPPINHTRCIAEWLVAQAHHLGAHLDVELPPVNSTVYQRQMARMMETALSQCASSATGVPMENPTGLLGQRRRSSADIVPDEALQNKSRPNLDTGDRENPSKKTCVQHTKPSRIDRATQAADAVFRVKIRPPEVHSEADCIRHRKKGEKVEAAVSHEARVATAGPSSKPTGLLEQATQTKYTFFRRKNRLPLGHSEAEACPAMSIVHRQEMGKKVEPAVSHGGCVSTAGLSSKATDLLERHKCDATDGGELRGNKSQLSVDTTDRENPCKTQHLEPTDSDRVARAADVGNRTKNRLPQACLEGGMSPIISAIHYCEKKKKMEAAVCQSGCVPTTGPGSTAAQKVSCMEKPIGMSGPHKCSTADVASDEVRRSKAQLNVDSDDRAGSHKGGCTQYFKPTDNNPLTKVSDRKDGINERPRVTDVDLTSPLIANLLYHCQKGKTVKTAITSAIHQTGFHIENLTGLLGECKRGASNEQSRSESRQNAIDDRVDMCKESGAVKRSGDEPSVQAASIDNRNEKRQPEVVETRQHVISSEECAADGCKRKVVVTGRAAGEIQQFDNELCAAVGVEVLPGSTVNKDSKCNEVEGGQIADNVTTATDGDRSNADFAVPQQPDVHAHKLVAKSDNTKRQPVESVQGAHDTSKLEAKTDAEKHALKLPKGSVHEGIESESLKTINSRGQCPSNSVGDVCKPCRVLLTRLKEVNRSKQGTAATEGVTCMLPANNRPLTSVNRSAVSKGGAAKVGISSGNFAEPKKLRGIKGFSSDQDPPVSHVPDGSDRRTGSVSAMREEANTQPTQPATTCSEETSKGMTDTESNVEELLAMLVEAGKLDEAEGPISGRRSCSPARRSPCGNNSQRASMAIKSHTQVTSPGEQRQPKTKLRNEIRKECGEGGEQLSTADAAAADSANARRRSNRAEEPSVQQNTTTGEETDSLREKLVVRFSRSQPTERSEAPGSPPQWRLVPISAKSSAAAKQYCSSGKQWPPPNSEHSQSAGNSAQPRRQSTGDSSQSVLSRQNSPS
ncbi:uncharacterized protein LOC126335798 [Schistocerca gregaria]|uniref:uncharacterized protein LOC126335798 n=1 Tax=Schistocerca gregaria TaxID=7010 RepID=UPI00211E1230|nr:uncharacterized protein LOC126335798 [Schistocerca gregaria]